MKYIIATIVLAFWFVSVGFALPNFDKILTMNAIDTIAIVQNAKEGQYALKCRLGRIVGGVFIPDGYGIRTIVIDDNPNFIKRDFNAAIKAKRAALPAKDPDIIDQAFWTLLALWHLTRDVAIDDLSMSTHIQDIYIDEIITVLESENHKPILSVSPTTLALNRASEGTVGLTNNGAGTLFVRPVNVHARMSLSSMGANIGGGQTRQLGVMINRVGLPQGSQSATFTLDSSGGSQVVTVTVVIAAPVLAVDRSSLDFGDALTDVLFVISNSGEAPLAWQCQSDHAKITFPDSGNDQAIRFDDTGFSALNGGDVVVINVRVDRSGMPPGTYNRQIDVTTNGGNNIIDVTVIVP